MYEITIEKTFAAAHALRLPDGTLEPVHGHNWPVRVTLAADVLDALQTVIDFHDVEKWLDPLLAQVHNKHLNDVEPFRTGGVNPSAERVAWWIATSLQRDITASVHDAAARRFRLVSVCVGEAPGCYATYKP